MQPMEIKPPCKAIVSIPQNKKLKPKTDEAIVLTANGAGTAAVASNAYNANGTASEPDQAAHTGDINAQERKDPGKR